MNFIRRAYKVGSKSSIWMSTATNLVRPATLVGTCRNENRFLVSHYASKASSDKANIVEVKDEDHFKNTLNEADSPLIIDFYAAWCGPCKMLTPKLEEAIKNDGRFKLLKVNIDKFPNVAQQYSVTSVPTVHAIYKNKPVRHFIGFQNTPGLEDFLKSVAEKIELK